MSHSEEDRERSLELLRAAHEFPGPYVFRVVIHPGKEPLVLGAMTDALTGTDPISDVDKRASRNGRFLSLRVTASLEAAEEVLAIYAALKAVDGVITVF